MGDKNKKKETYLLNDEENFTEAKEIEKNVKAKLYDLTLNPDGKFKNQKDFDEFKEIVSKMNPEDAASKLTVGSNYDKAEIIQSAESMKKVKINLSESDIMSIIVNEKKILFKKSDLMESIKNNLISEANMNDNVRQSFENGENDYSDFLDSDLINQLARESFDDIADNIRRKTGKQDVTLDDVQQLLSTSLINAAKEEYSLGIENLQRKAIQIISKEYNIPEGSVEFVATITGIPPKALVGRDISPREMEALSRQHGLKVGKVEKGTLKSTKGVKQPPQGKTHEQLKPKIKRRRFTNAMIHGAGRKSQNLHHSDDELRRENPQLVTNYSNIMAANDANYFLMDDQAIKQYGETGIHAGNVRVDLTNPKKPKIIAQGMVFPILLHELGKGVLELMSLWGLPQDREERQYVLDKTDHLEYETNDIRLGTKMWEKFVTQIPVDNQEVISLTWNIFQELGDDEYNSVVEGLLQNKAEAQQKVRRMAQEAIEELRAEDSETALGGYKDTDDEEEGDTITPDEEEPKDEILKSILGGQQGDESPEEPKDLNDMSKEELQNLMKSALEDEDYEFASQIRDILKNR
jgi:hypothetical protein